MCGIGLVFRRRKNEIDESASTTGDTRYEPNFILEDAFPFCEVFGDFETFLVDRLSHRGPDSLQHIECEFLDISGEATSIVKVVSSVLNMRNLPIVQQPIVDEHTIFQWNGEVYPYCRESSPAALGNGPSAQQPPSPEVSDTLWVQQHIQRIVGENLHTSSETYTRLDPTTRNCLVEDITCQIREFFENPRMKGAYAFAVVIPRLSTVIFGRDKVGRRSLVRVMCEVTDKSKQSRKFLIGLGSTGYEIRGTLTDGTFIHISTEDVSVEGVHSLQFVSACALSGGIVAHNFVAEWSRPYLRAHPLTILYAASMDKSVMNVTHGLFENSDSPLWAQLPAPSFTHHVMRDTPMRETRWYVHALYDAVAERILTAPVSVEGSVEFHVGLLFSGGVDSMLLAALIHWVIKIEFSVSASARFVIELLNVSFGESPERSPDRISARCGLAELRAAFPERMFRLVLIDASDPILLEHVRSELSEDIGQRIRSLVLPSDTVMDLNIATALWFASAGIGKVAHSSDERSVKVPCRLHRTAAVDDAFTEDMDPILDTSNNCFESLTKALVSEHGATLGTGTKKLPISMFGNTPYNIPYAKYGFSKLVQYMKAAQNAGICTLTVDEQKNYSIEPTLATLQHSGVREAPQGDSPSDQKIEKANSRLLFSGLGADETLAGYRRHRTAFHSKYSTEKTPLERLFHELDFDCGNLWRRNCGRDDRIVSDHGKELALPFLDEKVIDCIRAISMNSSMEESHFTDTKSTKALWDLTQRDGIGDKKLVRTAARMVGLGESTTLVKRAIQFGSRIAVRKMKGGQKI